MNAVGAWMTVGMTSCVSTDLEVISVTVHVVSGSIKVDCVKVLSYDLDILPTTKTHNNLGRIANSVFTTN